MSYLQNREWFKEDNPFDNDQPAVYVNGERRIFTMQEWLILRYLREREDKFVSIKQIEQWLYSGRADHGDGYNVIPVHICRIRKKLKDSGYQIRGVFARGFSRADAEEGSGYILERT